MNRDDRDPSALMTRSAKPPRLGWSKLLRGKLLPQKHPPVRHLPDVHLPQMAVGANKVAATQYPQDEEGLEVLDGHPVSLQALPESIIDDIKIHAPVPEGKMRKAQQRQSLFLKKRRESKKHRILKNRLMVVLRLVMFLVLTIAWIGLWRSELWQFDTRNTTLSFTNQSGPSANDFLDRQEFQTIISPYQHKMILMVDPDDIARKIQAHFPHVETVVVRRRVFPAGLTVIVTEKPLWATYYRLAKHDTSSLTDLMQRLHRTLEPRYKYAKPFERVVLLHPESAETVLPVSSLTLAQKATLKTLPAVFIQSSSLSAAQRKSLEQVVYVINYHQAAFKKAGYELVLIDARDVEDTFLVFNRFKVRLGRLDYLIAQRAVRLVELLEPIQRYENRLAWVELSWKGQVTFKLK